jgi:hypothetical protein
MNRHSYTRIITPLAYTTLVSETSDVLKSTSLVGKEFLFKISQDSSRNKDMRKNEIISFNKKRTNQYLGKGRSSNFHYTVKEEEGSTTRKRNGNETYNKKLSDEFVKGMQSNMGRKRVAPEKALVDTSDLTPANKKSKVELESLQIQVHEISTKDISYLQIKNFPLLKAASFTKDKINAMRSMLQKIKDEHDKEKLIERNRQHGHNIAVTTSEYYRIERLIGKGSFGKVMLGVHKLTGKYVSIKVISKGSVNDNSMREKVLREVKIHKKFSHVNVVRILEVVESLDSMMIVMEYVDGGDLKQYIKAHGRIKEDVARVFFKQIVSGLLYLHSKRILHRDIKPDNILLGKDLKVKICDFGISRQVEDRSEINDHCGTPSYASPEIILGQVFPNVIQRLIRDTLLIVGVLEYFSIQH